MWQDLAGVWSYLAAQDSYTRSDVIFCFGNSYLGTARRAASLHAAGLARHVVVTGGTRGRIAPHATEAAGFASVLRDHGVPDHAVITEHTARHTGENVVLGIAQAAARGLDIRSAVLLAFPTSLRRCKATFAHYFPDVRTSAVAAFDAYGPYTGDPVRAAAAALAELDRLHRYPDLGHMAATAIPGTVVAAAARLTAALGEAQRDATAPDDLLTAVVA